MKLADLRNFDLVVLRDGSLGIVLRRKRYEVSRFKKF